MAELAKPMLPITRRKKRQNKNDGTNNQRYFVAHSVPLTFPNTPCRQGVARELVTTLQRLGFAESRLDIGQFAVSDWRNDLH